MKARCISSRGRPTQASQVHGRRFYYIVEAQDEEVHLNPVVKPLHVVISLFPVPCPALLSNNPPSQHTPYPSPLHVTTSALPASDRQTQSCATAGIIKESSPGRKWIGIGMLVVRTVRSRNGSPTQRIRGGARLRIGGMERIVGGTWATLLVK
jgi:hypothetical protein